MRKKSAELTREAAREYAFTLFMANTPQKEIAEKTGVSKQSINRWVAEGGWAQRRAAKTISRPELANRLLKNIADEIDKLNNSAIEGGEGITPAAIDKLTKMGAMIEKLDKKAGVVESIEVFMAFAHWLQNRATIDPELTSELIKIVNTYQDKYISELMAKKAFDND